MFMGETSVKCERKIGVKKSIEMAKRDREGPYKDPFGLHFFFKIFLFIFFIHSLLLGILNLLLKKKNKKQL